MRVGDACGWGESPGRWQHASQGRQLAFRRGGGGGWQAGSNSVVGGLQAGGEWVKLREAGGNAGGW